MRKKISLAIMGIMMIMLFAGCGNTNIKLKDSAINNTVKSLQKDPMVIDVDIEQPRAGTIIMAIQLDPKVSKNEVKAIAEKAIRQLASNSGGKAPTKEYLGELWDDYNTQIELFSGKNTLIDNVVLSKGSNKIRY